MKISSFLLLLISVIAWISVADATGGGNPEDCDAHYEHTYRHQSRCVSLTPSGSMLAWITANQQCDASNPEVPSQLASPDSNEALQHMAWLMNQAGTNYAFVGINQTDKSDEPAGNWKLLTGDPLPAAVTWMAGSPSDSGGTADCGMVMGSGGTAELRDIKCNNMWNMAILCEHEVKHLSDDEKMVTDPRRLECLELGGQYFGSSCLFLTGNDTWDGCFTTLAQHNARPARFYSNDAMMKLTTHMPPAMQLWTGLKALGGQPEWMNDPTTPDAANGPSVRPMVLGQSSVTSDCGQFTQMYLSSDACTKYKPCMGEIVSPFQKYKKTMTDTNASGAASLIGTLLVAGSPQDERLCAFECQQIEGCLSFTFRRSNGNCTMYATKSDGSPSHIMFAPEVGVNYYERHW